MDKFYQVEMSNNKAVISIYGDIVNESYWFKMMETFWENVLLMNKHYGFTQLEYWNQIGELELEDFFLEFNEQTKKLSKLEKKQRRYEIVYKEKFR